MAYRRSAETYDHCAYLNCYNGKHSTGHRLFRFPRYGDSRHRLWLRNAGNDRLRTWERGIIHNVGICENHFSPESFTDDTRTSLRPDAVPKPYSAAEIQTEGSPSFMAYSKPRPRKRTMNRKLLESCKEIPKKEIPVRAHIADAVKTLRKVKMIKIEEQCSDPNKIVILERCKNPETCPASRRSNHGQGKAKSHFHKVFINKAKVSQNANEADGRVLEGSEESCENVAISTVLNGEAPKALGDKTYLTERYLLNVTTAVMKKAVSRTMRYREEAFVENSQESRNKMLGVLDVSDTDNNEGEKCEQAKIMIPEYIRKKDTSTTEFLDNYYSMKNDCGYYRCAYRNCKNGRFSTGSRLFRFPQSTDPRTKIWIMNAANPQMIYWSESTLRSSGLCSDHFTDDMFLNKSQQRLARHAIPKPFLLDENGDEFKFMKLVVSKFYVEPQMDKLKDPESILIDLPDLKVNNREELTIKYPFEDTEIEISDDDEATKYSSFVSVMLKSEPTDLPNTSDSERLSMTSGMMDIKDEVIEDIEEDPLHEESCFSDVEILDEHVEEIEQIDDIRKLIVQKEQKLQLYRTIKRFSDKLKNDKVRKNKLHS